MFSCIKYQFNVCTRAETTRKKIIWSARFYSFPVSHPSTSPHEILISFIIIIIVKISFRKFVGRRLNVNLKDFGGSDIQRYQRVYWQTNSKGEQNSNRVVNALTPPHPTPPPPPPKMKHC